MDKFFSLFLILSFFIPLLLLSEFMLVKLLKQKPIFLPSIIMIFAFFIMFLGMTFSLIHSSMVMIDTSDLLQINATVIAGILILLTIKSWREKNDIRDMMEKLKNKEREVTPTAATALIILPFSVSAILIIIEYGLIQYPLWNEFLVVLPPMYLFSTAIGFVYLICVIFIIFTRER